MMDKEPESILRTHRKRVISELQKGKKLATQLQTLVQNPCGDHGSHLAPDLTLQIFRSFTEALFQLNNCGSPQILADSDDRKWEDSGRGRKKNKGPAKARRGCYKRRKSSGEAWMKVSKTMEDGRAWRKYGQKKILNSKYPRCYFRCTHKLTQGCKAAKQVQRISEDEYQTMYFGCHTCKDSPRAPVFVIKSISDPDPTTMDSSHSQSFECSTEDNHHHAIDVSANQETQSGVSDAKSSDSNLWDGNSLTSESLAVKTREFYQGDKVSSFLKPSSTSSHNLDMDYSCFANLDNLFRSEEMQFFSD